MILWIWLAVMGVSLWFWLKRRYSYFKTKGVNYQEPTLFVGNLGKTFMRKESLSVTMDKQYYAFPKDRFFGSFELVNAVIYVRDPELIRQICIKDFDYFTDHNSIGGTNDPFFSKSLIALKGKDWRDMRSTLSPAFTASKLKTMVPLIMDCNKDLIETLEEQISSTSDNFSDLDTHDLLRRYTNDVIATCAFGLKTNSLKEKQNEFFEMGNKLTSLTATQILKVFLVATFPFIKKIKDIPLLDTGALSFLQNIVLRTMSHRDEKKIFRPDIIQILLEVKKGTLKREIVDKEKDAGFATVEESDIGKNNIRRAWGDDYLAAQAILFFFAGFDTVSTGMTFLLLELALNPEIQEKLREEINESHKNCDGNVTYETLNQMKYMDMVITESLRKWPPVLSMDRLCINNYNMGKPNKFAEKEFIIEKGTVINLPYWCIHRDPQYYPEPEKFDPERFSDENKHNIKPFTYMPFGVGPRNCIGSRFALIEMKMMAYQLIRKFEISPAAKTKLPPKLDPKVGFQPRLEGGAWLRFKPRTSVK